MPGVRSRHTRGRPVQVDRSWRPSGSQRLCARPSAVGKTGWMRISTIAGLYPWDERPVTFAACAERKSVSYTDALAVA